MSMYKIEQNGEIPDEFARCVGFAARHLHIKGDGRLRWLRTGLSWPFLEHLSFELGNQAFFVRVDDVSGKFKAPGNPYGFRVIAEQCNGHPCRMPMRRVGSEWKPEKPGWGLIDAGPIKLRGKLIIPFKDGMGEPVDPLSLVTDENIEMTDWEIHDLAVQVAREFITENRDCKSVASHGDPNINPSIWFDEGSGLQWVVVRESRHPDGVTFPTPSELAEILDFCQANDPKAETGYFAAVSIANFGDVADSSGDIPSLPLWRGHRMAVKFERGGLIPVEKLLKS